MKLHRGVLFKGWLKMSAALLLSAGMVDLPGQDRPYLLIRQEGYPELREKAALEPWKSMVQLASGYLEEAAFSLSPPEPLHYHIRKHATANALLRIVDPGNATLYATAAAEALSAWETVPRNRSAWADTVPPAASFVHCLVAFDILYPDMSSAQREASMEALEMYAPEISFNAWGLASAGAQAVWALFRADVNGWQKAHRRYTQRLDSLLIDGGGFAGGTGYAWARLGSHADRGAAKTHYMDIAEFTGFGDFYGREDLRDVYEWLFTFGMTPFHHSTTFGDTVDESRSDGKWWSARRFSLGRFSAKAAGYSAWSLQDVPTPFKMEDILINFLLAEELPHPQRPSSRAFPNSGAALWESEPSDEALMLSLWNATKSSDHAHWETNALHFAGLGTTLLRNSGYTGYGKGVNQEFGWDWIHFSSEANNVLVANGRDSHRLKSGAGISGFLFGPLVQFARGDSGYAIGDGVLHERDVFLVNRTRETIPYAFVSDLATLEEPTDTIQLAWHPDAVNGEVLEPDTAWRFPLRGTGPARAVHLDIVSAVHSGGSLLLPAGRADWTDSYVGTYLKLDIPVDEASLTAHQLTALVPGRDPLSPPVMLAERTVTASHIEIRHPSGWVDLVAARAPGHEPGAEKLDFNGRSLFRRLFDGFSYSVFATDFTRLEIGDGLEITSDHPLSLSLHGFTLDVSGEAAATLEIRFPGLSGTVSGSGRLVQPGHLRLVLAPGVSRFKLISDPPALARGGFRSYGGDAVFSPLWKRGRTIDASGWIHVNGFGWLFPVENGPGGRIAVYVPGRPWQWLVTGGDLFPWLWSPDEQSWIYYLEPGGPAITSWFYHYAEARWHGFKEAQ